MFSLKDIFSRAAILPRTKSLTAEKNKYLPHDGERKAERERENKILSLMPKDLAYAYRVERSDKSRVQKGIAGNFWDRDTKKTLDALALFDALKAGVPYREPLKLSPNLVEVKIEPKADPFAAFRNI